MLYDIINPSDPYTMEADTFAAALGAVAILGEGRYGLQPLGHSAPKVHPILFGDWPREVYKAAGVEPRNATGLMARMNSDAEFNEAVAKALDSVRYGNVADRAIPRDPNNDRRSSTNNIGGYAWKYAEAMRGKRRFAPVDAEAGNVE